MISILNAKVGTRIKCENAGSYFLLHFADGLANCFMVGWVAHLTESIEIELHHIVKADAVWPGFFIITRAKLIQSFLAFGPIRCIQRPADRVIKDAVGIFPGQFEEFRNQGRILQKNQTVGGVLKKLIQEQLDIQTQVRNRLVVWQ